LNSKEGNKSREIVDHERFKREFIKDFTQICRQQAIERNKDADAFIFAG
jgi:hypothetical protein